MLKVEWQMANLGCVFIYICVIVPALALQYMRAKNVSHMDLKPQNILLTTTYGTPQLKIAG